MPNSNLLTYIIIIIIIITSRAPKLQLSITSHARVLLFLVKRQTQLITL